MSDTGPLLARGGDDPIQGPRFGLPPDRIRVVKRLSLLLLACSFALASCLPTLEGFDYDLAGQDVRMTFMHTSDIHSRLIPYDFSPLKTDIDLGLIPEAGPFGGATRMAALLKRERARADRVDRKSVV